MLAVAEMSKDEEGRNSDLLSTSPFSPSISASLSSLYQCIAAPPSFCEALLDISYCHLLLASIHLDPVSYSCRCYCYSYNNYYIITFKIRNFIFLSVSLRNIWWPILLHFVLKSYASEVFRDSELTAPDGESLAATRTSLPLSSTLLHHQGKRSFANMMSSNGKHTLQSSASACAAASSNCLTQAHDPLCSNIGPYNMELVLPHCNIGPVSPCARDGSQSFSPRPARKRSRCSCSPHSSPRNCTRTESG
jgi:hypothetical protein